MNLFWETRKLALQAREDHLTCFIAAALDVDEAFRAAYEAVALSQLATVGVTPRIASVQIQVAFDEQRCCPDMMLTLADGRRVLCEHKIDALETQQIKADGKTVKQLERYLALPDIAGVAYFRSARLTMAGEVLSHELYLHPQTGSHFLWRDLYPALELGTTDVVRWLRDGFERLGFTPPVRHVGELWPGDSEAVRQNQRNFGKLWDRTHAHFEAHWKVHRDQRGCELYLKPMGPSLVSQIYIAPIAQGGSLLRTRASVDRSNLGEVCNRLEAASAVLPVTPELVSSQRPDGSLFVELLAPLRSILGDATDAAEHEARLYDQVVPAVDALTSEGDAR